MARSWSAALMETWLDAVMGSLSKAALWRCGKGDPRLPYLALSITGRPTGSRRNGIEFKNWGGGPGSHRGPREVRSARCRRCPPCGLELDRQDRLRIRF